MQSSKILPGFLHFEKEEWNRYFATQVLQQSMNLSYYDLFWKNKQIGLLFSWQSSEFQSRMGKIKLRDYSIKISTVNNFMNIINYDIFQNVIISEA